MVLLIEDESQGSPKEESSDSEPEDEYFPGAEAFGIPQPLIPLCDGLLTTDEAIVTHDKTPTTRKRTSIKAVKKDRAGVKVTKKRKSCIRRFRIDQNTKDFIEKHHNRHAMKNHIDPPRIASNQWFKSACLYGRATKVFNNSVTAEGLRSYVRRMYRDLETTGLHDSQCT